MINQHLVYPLFLFYGMAFFAMGVAITSKDTRSSHLDIAGCLWIFSLFAYTHAVLEWYSLFLLHHLPEFPELISLTHSFIKLGLVGVSFCFLLLFGVNILGKVYPARKKQIYLILPLLVFAVFSVITYRSHGTVEFSFAVADLSIRHLIGFPGAVISGLGMMLYSRTVRHISLNGALNFSGAGFFLICYGFLTGLIPSGGAFPLLGGPIELYRGISALIILYFLMQALHIFDVERKLQIEERLSRFAHSEKLHSLGKLAFGVAHEINNPLGNVSLNTELLRGDLRETEDFSRYEKRLLAIERNLDRASKIAKELLYFSTDKEADFQPTEINTILGRTLELLGARRKEYRITENLNPVPTISAVPWKLEEVFLNILINAMDATPKDGEIEISSAFQDDQIVVTISDSGTGIPSDILPNVLDPFFTTKEVGKGTGLGLPICFGIMEMHGGTIELNNLNGGGTAVTLEFPKGVKGDV